MAKSLGHEIHRVRQLRGLSLNGAATPAGVSAAYLQKLERDEVESPSPRRLHRLAEVLGVGYADLFQLAGYPLPTNDLGPQIARSAGEEPSPSTASALRRMFLSEDDVSDTELEELVRYLAFIRDQRSPQ